MPVAARRLSAEDLPGCLALSAEAGWNQTAADWHAVFALGEVRGLIRDGRLIASAAVLPWPGPFGWICMVLVTATERRQGHATRLLDWAVARLSALGRTPGLDATPAGRTVYLPRGFADVYPLTRLRAAMPGRLAPPPGTPVPRPMAAADLARVAALDAPAFGADRSGLLSAFRGRQPALAFLAEDAAGAPAGFVLGRDGRTATQIGPVIARDEAVATALIAAALAACSGPVCIDLPDRHAALGRALAGAGFIAERPFVRMLLGRSDPLDRPERVFALAGPEFG
jgi:GNAT superfamily N-acetyltransferase